MKRRHSLSTRVPSSSVEDHVLVDFTRDPDEQAHRVRSVHRLPIVPEHQLHVPAVGRHAYHRVARVGVHALQTLPQLFGVHRNQRRRPARARLRQPLRRARRVEVLVVHSPPCVLVLGVWEYGQSPVLRPEGHAPALGGGEVERPGLCGGELRPWADRLESLRRLVGTIRRVPVQVEPVRHVHDVRLHDTLQIRQLAAVQRPSQRHILRDIDEAGAGKVQERQREPFADDALDELHLDVRRLAPYEPPQHAVQSRRFQLDRDLILVVARDLVLVERLLDEQIRVELQTARIGGTLHEMQRLRGEQHRELLAHLVEDGHEALQPGHPHRAERAFELHPSKVLPSGAEGACPEHWRTALLTVGCLARQN